MPKISLLVVIKGPVAIAGSIPLLSKKRGINVPIIPATIITITREIEIARAPVTDGQSGLSYTQLTGITHTLPDTTAKRFIIDCNFGGSGVDVAANDVFLVAFKTTEGSNAFIRVNLTAFFEYPLPIIT